MGKIFEQTFRQNKTKHTEKADKYMKKIILVFIFISLQANAN